MSNFKYVPARMLLDKETIGAINFHCGDGADGQFGEYSDGLLWVGVVTDDEGKQVHGLHLATAEYPEEGSTTLVEFEAPEEDAQSELAALREELAEVRNAVPNSTRELVDLRKSLAAAEQRNAELIKSIEAINASASTAHVSQSLWKLKTVMASIARITDAAIKPTESGGSE
jgi:hypothetical protein